MKISKNLFNVILVILTLQVSSGTIYSQEDEDEEEEIYVRIRPKHSFSTELGLPVPLLNTGFKGLMQGVINFSPYYTYTTKNNISFGLGANYNFFWINHVYAPDTKNLGGVHATGLFVKLGHEKFHTDRLGTDFGVKFGASHLGFSSKNNTANLGRTQTKNIFYLEPTLAIVLSADAYTSYRWVIGYAIQNYAFNPTQLGFASSASYAGSDYSKITQFLTVGFGFSYYFKQRQY